MPSPISIQTNSKAGLCPHGLPPSACPICNGGQMSGGSVNKNNTTTKPEMLNTRWSYMRCYAVGMQLANDAARALSAKEIHNREIEYAKELKQTINTIADKIKAQILNIENSLPPIFQMPLQTINKVIITPILNLISQIPNIIEKLSKLKLDIKTALQQAGEKLTALLGDIKNFIDKKISEPIKKLFKKIFIFFVTNTEDENYNNDENLEIFKSREIRKTLINILKQIKKRDNDVNQANSITTTKEYQEPETNTK